MPTTQLQVELSSSTSPNTRSAISAPVFDARFSSQQPICYFHHIIDPSKGTLQVQVLGPNLSQTLTHSAAVANLTPASLERKLRHKTTGFLAFIHPGDNARIVLAWAESGHGYGPRGDCLQSQPTVLSNRLWTSRARHLAAEMKISMGHPYDRLTRGGRVGIFRASHVEVKLAVHAIYVLLRVFEIPTARATRQQLRQLRSKKWHGARPRFEIYFSRKNCGPCDRYVRALSQLTGVDIKLCWKERLVRVESDGKGLGRIPLGEIIEVGHTGEEEEAGDEVCEIEMVDLTDCFDEEQIEEPVAQHTVEWDIVERTDEGVIMLASMPNRESASRRNAVVTDQEQGRSREAVVVPEGHSEWDCMSVVDAIVTEREVIQEADTRQRAATPVSVMSTWLATPPPSNYRPRRQATPLMEPASADVHDLDVGRRSPRLYSFVSDGRGPLA